jgi:hypothetical protein
MFQAFGLAVFFFTGRERLTRSDPEGFEHAYPSPVELQEPASLLVIVARPGRVELPTLCLEGRRSIQLSYGRAA